MIHLMHLKHTFHNKSFLFKQPLIYNLKTFKLITTFFTIKISLLKKSVILIRSKLCNLYLKKMKFENLPLHLVDVRVNLAQLFWSTSKIKLKKKKLL